MKTLKTTFLLCLISLKVYCFVPIETVYQGTIGSFPVVMIIEYDASNKVEPYSASYFYKKQKRDIDLSGKLLNGLMTIYLKDEDDKILEIFSLKKNGTTLQGTWRSGAKILNVLLTEVTNVEAITNRSIPLPNFKDKSAVYSYLKIAEMVLKKNDSTSHFMEFKLSWWTESNSKITFFRVENGYSDDILKKINSFLEKKQFEYIDNYYSCETKPKDEIDYFADMTPTFLDDKYLSFYINSGYYCGGAHPDSEHYDYTFDVKNNLKTLTLEDFIYFKEGKPPIQDSDTWMNYRTAVFAPKLLQILKKIFPKEIKQDSDCDSDEPSEWWSFCNWHLTKKGLYINSVPPYAAKQCRLGFTIPYETLSKYGKGKYPFPKTK
jgi:Deacetylase PdaC